MSNDYSCKWEGFLDFQIALRFPNDHSKFVFWAAIPQSWTKGWRQYTKLSKIGFSMECFTADFLQFFTKKRKNLAFGWTPGHQTQAFQGFFWNFLISYNPKSNSFGNSWSNSYILKSTCVHAKNSYMVKSEKASKCSVQDCS